MLLYYLLNKVNENNRNRNKARTQYMEFKQKEQQALSRNNSNKSLGSTLDILDKSVVVVQKTERAVGEIKPFVPFLVNLPMMISLFKLMNSDEFKNADVTKDTKDSDK